jgi:hypothetical protein
MSNDITSPPLFMTCGDLIHQEDQYVREYATVRSTPIFNPDNV